MIRTVSAYIEKHQLFDTNDLIIVGLSGGADSVALLHILVRLGYNCIAAHCNFHLRGKESDEDEIFTGKLAKQLNVSFYKKNFDTTTYARENHLSIEMAARDLRYQWFEQIREEFQAQVIAVAHHQDDSVETFLLNMIRGTGVRGLSGIRPKNGAVVRPLLSVNRIKIVEWLAKENINFQTDSTNLSDAYTRNFIRLRIIPLLEELNPSVKEAIIRTSNHLSDLEKVYTSWLEKERPQIIDSQHRISIPKLLNTSAPQSLLYELIKPFGFTRLLSDSIFSSVQGQSGKIFDAPHTNYRIIKDREFLLISTQKEKNNMIYSITDDDSLEYPIKLKTFTKSIESTFEILKETNIAYFDYNKLIFPLTLRTWHKGDSFIPFGMKGRKKISDYFADRKFNRIQKEQIWLLCSGIDIIWIIGERTDERYRIKKSTKRALIAVFFD